MSEESLTVEELNVVQSLKHQKDVTNKNSEIADLQSKVAELMYNNTILKLYLKYNLSGSDGIDDRTGQIIRNVEEDKNEEDTEARDVD